MIYYILLPKDNEMDTLNDSNILGEVIFNKFKPNDGFKVLTKIINEYPEMWINEVRILDQTGKKYSIEQFFDILEKY
jgi:hypothetical protein